MSGSLTVADLRSQFRCMTVSFEVETVSPFCFSLCILGVKPWLTMVNDSITPSPYLPFYLIGCTAGSVCCTALRDACACVAVWPQGLKTDTAVLDPDAWESGALRPSCLFYGVNPLLHQNISSAVAPWSVTKARGYHCYCCGSAW
jgi:hypothetical protein